MKKKFSKILGVGLTLALLTSLLMTAAPVSALSVPTVAPTSATISATTSYAVTFNLGKELLPVATLEPEGTSTAVWVTDAPTGYTGTYAAKLTCTGSGLTHWSAAKVAYGKTLATLVALTATKGSYTVLDVAFNVWATDNPVNYAMLWIDEDADGTVDTRLTGGFDVDGSDGSVISLAGSGWLEAYKTSAATWQLRDYAAGIVTTYSGTNTNAIDSLPGYLADGGVNAIVVYVGVGYTGNTDPAYVDDITIGGVNYPLEPASSAFQVSVNAGLSWNQSGLIDILIAAINDIAVVSCDTAFMVTDAFSLWKTIEATAAAPIWERILTPLTVVGPTNTLITGGSLDLVATSPEFDGDGVDDMVLVTNTNANIGVMKSTDGGDIFTPMGAPIAPITALCVVDDTFAFTGAAAQVYRTDDGAYSWLAAIIPPAAGTMVSFATSPDYANDSTLLVGNDAGLIYRSENSGATFTVVGATIGAFNAYVAFDPEYATNSLIYAAGNAVIARYNFTATALGWVNIDATIPAAGLVGASVFSYSVTLGSATIAVSNDPDGDVTIVGTTVTLPDAADAVAITAGALGATVTVTLSAGTQTCVPVSGTALATDATMTVTYLTGGAVTGSVINGLLTSPDGTIYGSNLSINQGVERSLNPRSAPPAPPPTFERVTDQLAATATLAGLWLVVDPALDVVGSKNVLFSIDTTGLLAVDRILTYTDTLATTVVLTEPEDGTVFPRETAVTMVWEELTGADTYHWQIATDSRFMLVVDEGNSRYTSDSSGELAAGRTYFWRVRVEDAAEVGDPLFSRWSNAPAYEPSAHWTFTTFLGERPWHPFMPIGGVNPSPGATDVPVKPTFQWNGADWATTYDLELADNAAFTGATKKTLSTTAWTCDPALDYGTTYYWKVKAVSDVTESEWTDVGVFTTVAEVVPPAKVYSCPQCGLEFSTEAALQAHWDKFHAPPTPVTPTTPAYIWAIIGVGALLVVAVLVLILRTRRVA